MQAFRVLLQQGVQPSWFSLDSASSDGKNILGAESQPLGTGGGDLRQYLLEAKNPLLGETVFAEVLLKALGPYCRTGEGCHAVLGLYKCFMPHGRHHCGSGFLLLNFCKWENLQHCFQNIFACRNYSIGF